MRIEIGQINFGVMLFDHSYTTRLLDLTSLQIQAIWWSLQPWHIQKVPPLWSPVLHPLQYCDVYFFLEWIPLNGHSLQYPLALRWHRPLFVIRPCLTTTFSWFMHFSKVQKFNILVSMIPFEMPLVPDPDINYNNPHSCCEQPEITICSYPVLL